MFSLRHTCIFVYKWQVWPEQHWLNQTHRVTQYFNDWGLLEEKKYLFSLLLAFPAISEASGDINLLCKDFSMLFPSGKPHEFPKKACSHNQPTLFLRVSEVKKAESRSLLANWIAANSLLPVFLLSLTFTVLQLKLLIHYHSDCVSVYWESLTLFIVSLILSLRPCVAPSCPYLCSYLYRFPLVLPSHSFLELILSSGPSGLYHPPAFAQLPHFLSPWQTSPSMFCKNQIYSLGMLLRSTCYSSISSLWTLRKKKTKHKSNRENEGKRRWEMEVEWLEQTMFCCCY